MTSRMKKSTSGGRRDSGGSDVSTNSSRIPVTFTPTLPRRQRSSLLSRQPSLHSLRSQRDETESVCSGTSSTCEHSHFALNGSTYSGRSKRYIVHCSPQRTEPEEYLTPTQRANATIRKLKSMLGEAQSDLAARDEEIARLSRELVELRLQQSVQRDEREEEKSPPGRTSAGGSPRSLSDSGHFEELSPEPSLSSRNQLSPCEVSPSMSVDALAQKLAEVNERYFELKPQYEELCKRLEVLEFEKAELETKFEANEEAHRRTYLEMFRKGQEAAKFQAAGDETDSKQEGQIPQLLRELEVTKAELESVKDVDFWNKTHLLSGDEAVSIWNLSRKTMYRKLLESNAARKANDAEITLQFLKSAFFYLMTDRENTSGHLSAIEGILGFSPEERQAIDKAAYLYK